MPDVAIEAQGCLVAIANRNGNPPPVQTTRGAVTSFSAASRLRLMRKLARLEAVGAVFMTLTYPARYPDADRAKEIYGHS